MSARNRISDGFEPSDEAERLGEELVSAVDVQEDVLREALETGEESGRSICGQKEDAREPTERSWGNVVLPGCPIDRRALIHGGGGHNFEAPEHSLIDMAAVLFGLADAHMVVGSQESDLMLAPVESQVEDAQAVYENALGIEVESPDDVVRAFETGLIHTPSDARRKVREQLDGLFSRVPTPHPGLREDQVLAAAVPDVGQVETAIQRSRERSVALGEEIGAMLDQVFEFNVSDVRINLAQVVVSQLADAIVLLAFLAVLGGRPQSFIRQRMSASP